jgi:hypothetical protein
VLQVLYFWLPNKFVVIQLVQSERDGMVNPALNLLAHLDHSIMEVIVFVQIPTVDAYHGSYLMEKTVFTSKTPALKELDGTAQCALQLSEIVQMVSIKQETNASLSLNNVFLLQHGPITNVFQTMENAHMVQSEKQIAVSLTVLVKVDKFGILIFYNVLVQKELDGVVKNVLFAAVDKYGVLKMAVLALKDNLCLEPDAKK